MKYAVIAALLTVSPLAVSAEPAVILYVPRSDHYIAHLYVHAFTAIDVSLPPGESAPPKPVAGDPRWNMVVFPSGNTVHVMIKPTANMPENTLITIPTSGKAVHLLMRSGANESTAYTVNVFEPTFNPLPKPRTVAIATPAPLPTPQLKVVVADCAPPLDAGYKIKGDARIDIQAVCDDGKRTFFLVGAERGQPMVVPHRIDPGGHTDEIVNATFSQTDGTHPSQWIADGVSDHWALLTDTSRGQMRKNVDRK